ncbi:MAG: hypothetical protein ACKPCM_10740 [Pseudanabaena sp.]
MLKKLKLNHLLAFALAAIAAIMSMTIGQSWEPVVAQNQSQNQPQTQVQKQAKKTTDAPLQTISLPKLLPID